MLDVVPYPWRKEEQRRVAVWYRSRDSLLSSVIILNLIYKPLHSHMTLSQQLDYQAGIFTARECSIKQA